MKLLIIVVVTLIAAVKGNRISGGDIASIAQYPFAAALLTNHGSGTTYEHACGGTILTSTSILSAASCFYTDTIEDSPNYWRARVGSSSANSGGTIYIIGLITAHPDFSPTTRVNDIAVLRTTLQMTMSPSSVEVARIAMSLYTINERQPVTAIGWGATSSSETTRSEELRHVQIWVADRQLCTSRYNSLGFTVTDNMICAGWLDVGVRGQCVGDNGSPLVEDGVVIGVHSWSEGCGHILYPSINTFIPSYITWIIQTATAALS